MKFSVDVPFYASAAFLLFGLAAVIFFATDLNLIWAGAAIIFALACLIAFAIELREDLRQRKHPPRRL